MSNLDKMSKINTHAIKFVRCIEPISIKSKLIKISTVCVKVDRTSS